MNNIIPFFELDGIRYEIKKTRYIIAEYDKISEQDNSLTEEDRINSIKIQSLAGDVQRYGEKVKELEEKFFETFNTDDERKYLKVKELYDKKLEELTVLEVKSGSSTRLQKAGIDALEKIAIKGLAYEYFNGDEKPAKELWERHAGNIGNDKTVEWLSNMSECLFHEDDENKNENDFLSQMRKMREQKEINRKNGIKRK